MRLPTFPELLFAISMVFFIAFVSSFNSELLGGESLCKLSLLSGKQASCSLNDNSITNFRLVVHSGGSTETIAIKVPVSIIIRTNEETIKYDNILPKNASAGAGRKYESNLNYGVYDLPKGSVNISVKASDNVKRLSLFNAKILKGANDYYIHLLGITFLLILFFSIYSRKRIFVNGIGKPLPYLLYFFVAVLVLTWAR
ncbi:hypothetical protein EXU30_17585 [Shewanella maritima]|uniref:Uncharacterized protein n=1 Tax=Shewanella maritima TaxID=2520507 RepID=A0A411PLB0_9GAMM|nr:hypothetical protein [Shewanella maritima]QBF84281.1 hypothetical protein EXU30_17585 [Shewanella maritima]